jgi:glycine oxidase
MIIIVGAGIAGLSLGWELLKAGEEVIIVEKDLVAAGASGASGAYLEPRPGKGKLRALEWASLNLWPEFADQLQQQSNIDIGFRHDGVTHIAFEENRPKLEKAAEFHRTSGWNVDWMDGDALGAFEPGLSTDIVAGYHLPQVHHLDARLTCKALAIAYQKNGGILHEGAGVAKFRQRNDMVEVTTTNGMHFEANKIVIAAALGSNQIGGLPADVPQIRPVRGIMLEMQMDNAAPLVCRPMKRPDGVLLPLQDGRLLVGSSHEEGESEPVAPDAIVERILASAVRAVPQIADLPIIEKRAGIRTLVGDGLLRLGRSNQALNVYYSLSHAGAGFLRAPVIAKELAAVINNPDTASRWITPFFKS